MEMLLIFGDQVAATEANVNKNFFCGVSNCVSRTSSKASVFLSFLHTSLSAKFIPECVAKGSRLTLEALRLESCSPSVARATATVRRCSQ